MKKLLAIVLSAVLLISILPINVLAEGTEDFTEGIFKYTISSGNAILKRCDASASGEITIPSTLGGCQVTEIEMYAFSTLRNITKVNIPNTVKTIRSYAFLNCSGVTELVIPNGVEAIDKGAFQGCTSIKDISLPFVGGARNDASKSVFGYIFDYTWYTSNKNVPTSIENVTITEGGNIYDRAFLDCTGIKEITLSTDTTMIGGAAFSGCTSLEIINGLSENVNIGAGAFKNTIWYNNLPEGVYYIGTTAALYKNPEVETTEIVIKDGTTRIGTCVFQNSTIKSVTIPSSVKRIEYSAFESCRALETVINASGVEFLGQYCFAYCTLLKEITTFENLKELERAAFWACINLKEVSGLDKLEKIGYGVFDQCYELESIEFPNNLIFTGNPSLKSTKWYQNQPLGLVYVGNAVYNYKGTAPEILEIPNGVVSIVQNAFSLSSEIEILIIPDTVKTIYDSAIGGTTIKTIYYRGTPEQKAQMVIEDKGSGLLNATWRYDYCGDGNHTLSGDCDLACNICDFPNKPTAEHTYDNETCDVDCNLCGYKKSELSHSFDNPVDHSCNVCNYTRQKTDRWFYEGDIRYYINSDGTLAVTIRNSTSTDIVIPGKLYGRDVVAIEQGSFYGDTAINSIVIPDSVTSIGDNVLFNCPNLKSVTIGKGITSIPENTIYSCEALESITVTPGNPKYHSEGNCLIETATKRLVRGTLNSEIPEDGSVTTIGKNAFWKLGIEGMIIPENITTVEERAFGWCEKLLFLMVKNNTGITFYQHAFTNCNSLEVVFFVGTIEDTANITVYQGNSIFLDAYWYLEACPVYGTHYIEDPCDETCVECGALVIPNHIYDDENDIICNGCGCNKNIPYIVTSDTYFVGSVSIRRIVAGTTAEEFLSKFNEAEYCKVFKGNTEVDSKAAIGTGMKVKITDGKVLKADYTVIVTGDTNGDGAISVTDMISIKSHILGKSTLSDEYATAADTSGDREISITDFIQIKAKILGKGDIVAH